MPYLYTYRYRLFFAAVAGAAFFGAAATEAADSAPAPDVAGEIAALKARITELESQQHENWLSKERETQIRAIVGDVLKDAKARGELGGADVGYKDGFYIQTPDKGHKLTIGGYIQARYEFAQANATNGRTLAGRTVGTGGSATSVIPHDPADSNGLSVRKARITFSGNVISPDLTFKLEGDFYGGNGGGFTITDAFAAYRFSDLFNIRAGSYKVPFAKAELTSDTFVTTMERAEVLSPFDPIRALGVSLYGDLVKDQLAFEVAANDGGQTNTLRRPDTTGLTANLDNRLAFYGRVQWAGHGKISDFAGEADLRDPAKPRDFIWLLGGAVGYESQNSTNSAFPSPQTTTLIGGLSNNGNGPGFANYTLNGDLFRATIDWSAKWEGLSLLTAAYFQQVNANPGNTSATSGTTIATGPFGASNSSFFQHAYYGQVGYFVIPQRLELIARAGVLLTEGLPNIGEVYTVGRNYYIHGHNLKIQADVTYTSEAPFTDAASGLLQNTHDVIGRIQLQAKF